MTKALLLPWLAAKVAVHEEAVPEVVAAPRFEDGKEPFISSWELDPPPPTANLPAAQLAVTVEELALTLTIASPLVAEGPAGPAGPVAPGAPLVPEGP